MNHKRIYIALVTFFMSTVIIFICFSIKPAKASDGIYREKCVATVQVEEGDTIWSIASQYYTTDYNNINDLISEIKKSNHIDDNVFIGQHIIVPHYKEIS